MDNRAQLSAHILDIRAELPACKLEISRLHGRCHDLESQVVQGSAWLQALQDSLTSLQTRFSHMHYLAQAVFRVLRKAFTNLGQELAIYV